MKKIFLIFLVVAMAACAPRERKWVAIGDSITYLNDHLDETGNRVTKGYMTLVSEKLPAVKFVNKGYNGWTSGGITKEIENLELEPADVYSVFLGTNDWWAGRPIGTMADYENNTGDATLYGAYRIIFDKLKSLNNDAQIILMTPLQRADFVYINDPKNNAYGSYKAKKDQTLEQFADAIADIGAHENADVIDLYHDSGITVENCVKFKRLRSDSSGGYTNYAYPDFIDVAFDPSGDEYPYPEESIDMTYDGLHPSDAGNEIIATMIVGKLK